MSVEKACESFTKLCFKLLWWSFKLNVITIGIFMILGLISSIFGLGWFEGISL